MPATGSPNRFTCTAQEVGDLEPPLRNRHRECKQDENEESPCAAASSLPCKSLRQGFPPFHVAFPDYCSVYTNQASPNIKVDHTISAITAPV